MSRSFPPPPTKFGPAGIQAKMADAKAAPAAPPPPVTRFGATTLQRQAEAGEARAGVRPLGLGGKLFGQSKAGTAPPAISYPLAAAQPKRVAGFPPCSTLKPLSSTVERAQQGVIQAATVVGGIGVTFTPGYASWTQDGGNWHINWKLGQSVRGEEVYHVTQEGSPKNHYFFTLSAGEISDATAPKGFAGKGKTKHKFSALPTAVEQYVRTNISNLMGA